MSLRAWLRDGFLAKHQTSRQEITSLLALVDRDLADARVRGVSADRRFATAYAAALNLATIVLAASGYRTAGRGHHWVTIQALPELLGPAARGWTAYLDACRAKRNASDYERTGGISTAEVRELVGEVPVLRAEVLTWLASHHPELVPSGP